MSRKYNITYKWPDCGCRNPAGGFIAHTCVCFIRDDDNNIYFYFFILYNILLFYFFTGDFVRDKS